MRPTHLLTTRISPASLLPLLSVFGSAAFGATIVNFDGITGTPYTLSQFGAAPGATVQTIGGNPDGYLQLTPASNDQNNWITFDKTDGVSPVVKFSFDFQAIIGGAGGADGFSFSLLPTATQGTTGGVGSALFTPEDPALPGVLGFGFDTWGNGGTFDANGNSANYSEISIFYDGGLVFRVDDTRALPTFLDLKDGAWHTVNGTIDFLTTKVNMTVDGNPVITDQAVPGLAPYESRVAFAGRTGNANENLGIDNINVQFVPEPTAIGALAIGGLVLLKRRRLA
jgi:hypothetical protein